MYSGTYLGHKKELSAATTPTYGVRRLLLIVTFVAILAFSANAQIQVALSPDATADAGSSVAIPITVSDLTNRDVLSYTAIVIYDSTVLEATGVDVENTIAAQFGIPDSVTIRPGRIRVKDIDSTPLVGAGPLINLVFNVIGDPGDATDLTFDAFAFNNLSDPPFNTINGHFTVNAPEIEVTPATHDFGANLIGSSTEQTFTIRNKGKVPLELEAAQFVDNDLGQFSLTGLNPPQSINVNASQTFTISFRPTVTGPDSAFLRLTSNDPAQQTLDISLSGQGEAVMPIISVDPQELDFGPQTVNQSALMASTIRNTGNAVLIIKTLTFEGPDADQFNLKTQPPPSQVAPGDSQTLLISFKPESEGLKTASLIIESDDPKTPRVVITLNGRGTSPLLPDISISPAVFEFGPVFLDSTVLQAFEISNGGNAVLDVSATSLSPPDSQAFQLIAGAAPFSVAAGATHRLVVAFSPNAPGIQSTVLQVTSNDPDEQLVTVQISGTGVVLPAPRITLQPDTINFGSVTIDSATTQNLAIMNTGTALLTVGETSLAGPGAGDFLVAGGGAPFTVAPGSTHILTASFAPTVPGTRFADLNIGSNDPDRPFIALALTGVGVVAPEPNILVQPTPLVFPETIVDSTAKTTLLVSNTGTAPLAVTETELQSSTSAFRIAGGGAPFTVAPDSQHVLEIEFLPDVAGAANDSLRISSSDPDEPLLKVALTGTAVVPPRPDIAVQPDSIAFGDVTIDSVSRRDLYVLNQGTGVLNISGITLLALPQSGFSFTASTPISLAAGDSQAVAVLFAPVAVGQQLSALQIASDDPDRPLVSVPLTGTGLEPPQARITVSSDSLDFGDRLVATVTTMTFEISNTGTAELRISAVTVSGNDGTEFDATLAQLPLTLQPDSSSSVAVTFSPTSPGVKEALLQIVSNDPGNPTTTLALAGNALPLPKPVALVRPDSLAFGFVLLDSLNQSSVLLLNAGTAPLEIKGVRLTGTNPEHFELPDVQTQFTLAQGDSQSVSVAFRPNQAGSQAAQLEIVTDDPAVDTLRVPLSGFGVAPLALQAAIKSPVAGTTICGDSVRVLVSAAISGGAPPLNATCRVNGVTATSANGFFSVMLPLSVGSNRLIADCVVQDALGQTAMARDTVAVTATAGLRCTTKIISPRAQQDIPADSVTVFAAVQIEEGPPPISVTCSINGVVARHVDGNFVATIPCIPGKFTITAVTTAVNQCGNASFCSDKVEVECSAAFPIPGMIGIEEQNESLVHLQNDTENISNTAIGPLMLGNEEIRDISSMTFDAATGELFVFSKRNGGELLKAQTAENRGGGHDIQADLIGRIESQGLAAMSVHPETGKIYAIRSGKGELVTIDRESARVVTVGAVGFPAVSALAFSRSAAPTLFGVAGQDGRLIAINPATGLGTQVGSDNPGLQDVECLTSSETGWLIAFSSGPEPKLVAIDPASGRTSELTAFENPLSIQGMAFVASDPATLLPTSVAGTEITPTKFQLAANYPNPFNPGTKITFDIPAPASSSTRMQLHIFNVLGELVKTLVDEPAKTGRYTVEWDGKSSDNTPASSGLYIYQLILGVQAQSRTMLLLK